MSKKHYQNILVCCGSSEGIDPEDGVQAERLGTLLAANRYSIVYGGGEFGLMGKMIRPAIANNASITSIYPQAFAFACENFATHMPHIQTPDLTKRKAEMIERSDAAVYLAGGIGTLDEVLDVMAWNDAHAYMTPDKPIKPLILINRDGTFDPVLQFVRNGIAKKRIKPGRDKMLYTVKDSCEAIRLLNDLNRQRPQLLSALNLNKV